MVKLKTPSGFHLRVRTAGVAALLMIVLGSLSLTVPAAEAQQLPTAKALGSYIDVGGTYNAFQAQYPRRILAGAGAYVDLNFTKHIGIEAEGRFLRQNQIFGSYEDNYLAGPRLVSVRGRFSPYVKGLVGSGHLNFPLGAGYGNYLVIGGGAGLDIRMTDKLKLRVIDFEYQEWPHFSFGQGYSLGSISPYGISAGLSYRVFHAGGWPKKKYKY
jgi:hypothetical protein